MQHNKHDQFLACYEPVHERFERFCRARVYGRMEFRDLMHETLLIAYEKFETLQSQQAFLSYLIGISVRILANKKRKQQTDFLHDQRQVSQHADDGNSPADLADIHFLYTAMAQLPAEQQESLILFEINGFSIREIAALHNASESAVKQRLKRGREKLTELLTQAAVETTKETYHG